MSDIAAHLVDSVLPEVPIRQWVCTLPWRFRCALGYDRKLCADVLGAFTDALKRSLRWCRIVQHLTTADRMDTVVRLVPPTANRGSLSFQPNDIATLLGEAKGRGEAVQNKSTKDRGEADILELERFRYEVDINAESAAMFFADLVLLVEGATEMAVLRRLLETDLLKNMRSSTEVVQTYGKFGMIRYLAILNAFGIPTVMIHDKDTSEMHQAWNVAILKECQASTVAANPIVLDPDFEGVLEWGKAPRPDLKPAFALKILAEAIESGETEALTTLCERIQAAANPVRKESEETR